MADQNKKTPWGDALAPYERQGRDGELGTVWIDLGPVWLGDNGSLQLTLLSEPLHWRSHGAERRIVIKPREGAQSTPAPQQLEPARCTVSSVFNAASPPRTAEEVAATALRDELARALYMRGVVGTFAVEIVLRHGDPEARDDFRKPWEQLSLAVQGHWLALAGTAYRASVTTGWAGDRGAFDFHSHLNACKQCANEPFDLCAVGASLLELAQRRHP